MIRGYIIFGVLLCSLLLAANSFGWSLWRSMNPSNWGHNQNGVYYHGSGFYHK